MLRNKVQSKRRWLDLAPGDPVIVVAGKDKGKHGEVLRTLPDKHKIVVKGVNILKRHTKAGGAVRYLQLPHNQWDAKAGYSKVQVLYNFGREDERTEDGVIASVAGEERTLADVVEIPAERDDSNIPDPFPPRHGPRRAASRSRRPARSGSATSRGSDTGRSSRRQLWTSLSL